MQNMDVVVQETVVSGQVSNRFFFWGASPVTNIFQSPSWRSCSCHSAEEVVHLEIVCLGVHLSPVSSFFFPCAITSINVEGPGVYVLRVNINVLYNHPRAGSIWLLFAMVSEASDTIGVICVTLLVSFVSLRDRCD